MLVCDFLKFCNNSKLKFIINQNGNRVLFDTIIGPSSLKFYPYIIKSVHYINYCLRIEISDEKHSEGFSTTESNVLLPQNTIRVSDLIQVLDKNVMICCQARVLTPDSVISNIHFSNENKNYIYIE